MTDERAEALRKLGDRLGRASEETERLIAEAEQHAEPKTEQAPPAGWQAPTEDGSSSTTGGELDALIAAVRSLRDLVPPEVVQRLGEALKEVLLAVRALIDYYLDRLERRREAPPSVEDIPIE